MHVEEKLVAVRPTTAHETRLECTDAVEPIPIGCAWFTMAKDSLLVLQASHDLSWPHNLGSAMDAPSGCCATTCCSAMNAVCDDSLR